MASGLAGSNLSAEDILAALDKVQAILQPKKSLWKRLLHRLRVLRCGAMGGHKWGKTNAWTLRGLVYANAYCESCHSALDFAMKLPREDEEADGAIAHTPAGSKFSGGNSGMKN